MATVSSNTLTTGKNLPPPQSRFVDPKTGVISTDGYNYLIGLINQIANAIPTTTVASGLAASGTTQATAIPLTAGWNEVDTADATDNGVLLASLSEGQSQTVVNLSGMSINVYPPAQVQINALGINQPYVLVNGSRITFDFFSATQVRS